MIRFKILEYMNFRKYRQQTVKISMFIPGVNSGVYTKALHIAVKIKDKRFFKDKISYTEITLDPKQVEELRDECNKILSL